MKKIYLFLILFLGLGINVNGQFVSGPTEVLVGAQITYTHSIGQGGYYFVVTGGTIINSSNTELTVLWEIVGTGNISLYQVGHYLDHVVVDVLPKKYLFTYDAAGNRIKRVLSEITLKNAKIIEEYIEYDKEKPSSLVLDGNVMLYPNPTADRIYIASELTNSGEKISINIFDISGNLIRSDHFVSPSHEIDMTSYMPGTYILILSANGSQKRFKVIKE